MSNFKPLHEQIANKLVADLAAGKSIFHREPKADGARNFLLPVNVASGNNYRGPAALILLMQNREDPRWMSFKQASFNKTPVEKGEKSTLIQFMKKTDIQPVLEGAGEPVKENGKAKMQEVKLPEPVLTDAFLFNGEQLKDMPSLKDYLRDYNATDRTAEQTFLAVNNAQSLVNKSADQMADDIREVPGKVSLRQEIAAILLSAEIGTSYELGDKADQVPAWIAILKEEPAELFKAADDAQKLFDQVMASEKNIVAMPAEKNTVLTKGEVIAYSDKEYTVLSELKNKQLQMQEDTGRKFKLSPDDGLYKSLVEARNNPVEKSVAREEASPEAEIAEEYNQEYQAER